MEFIVHTPDVEKHFHGESRYSIENGVLIVYSEDGKRHTYSPSFWQRISEDAPPENMIGFYS
jgi:hypothetical protein